MVRSKKPKPRGWVTHALVAQLIGCKTNAVESESHGFYQGKYIPEYKNENGY